MKTKDERIKELELFLFDSDLHLEAAIEEINRLKRLNQIQEAKKAKDFLEMSLELDVRALELAGQKTRALSLQRSNELAVMDKSLHALDKYLDLKTTWIQL